MPSGRKTLHFKSAAAAQRHIDSVGGDAVVKATVTIDKRSEKEKTEAQKQLKAAESKKLENRFEDVWRHYCPEVRLTPQYIFRGEDGDRRWRWDFCIPELKVAFEIDGGTFSDERSGHNWGTNITDNFEKQNAGMVCGWQVFRFTTDMLQRKRLPKYVEPVADYVLQQLSFLAE